MSAPFLRRVAIRNFKSIEACDVPLGRFTVLVGRNGAGKSNFLDGLRFISDSLQTSLDYAVQSRGGIDAVCHHGAGHPQSFSMRLEFNLSPGVVGAYAFEIAGKTTGTFVVKRERLVLVDHQSKTTSRFDRQESSISDALITSGPKTAMPPVSRNRLYLVNAAGLPDFQPVYDALLSMGFYKLDPEAIKEVQTPDAGERLRGDGANIASVVARVRAQHPQAFERIKEYLSRIVPGVEDFARETLGPKETLIFRQKIFGLSDTSRFYASTMSDGTLRALGALVAVTQLVGSRQPIRFVGIEEPETALHPAAAGALMDALREASVHTQVVITTHSPDLLDELDADRDTLLIVDAREATSRIAHADRASRAAIQQHLYSPGELLRMDQLQPDDVGVLELEQLDLFASPVTV